MKKVDILNSLDQIKYDSSVHLSATCRAFAIMIGGVAITKSISEGTSPKILGILSALCLFFVLEVIQYLVSILRIEQLYSLYESDRVTTDTLENKMASLQNTSFAFLYAKLTTLLVSIVLLIIAIAQE